MYENKHLGKIAILVGAESEGLGQDSGRPGRDPGGGGSLMAAGVVHIPWYATLFRGDKFEAALAEIAPIALRYGATRLLGLPQPRRPYKFLQMRDVRGQARTSRRYWYGPEFIDWRADYSSWYQVPVLYAWTSIAEAVGRRAGGSRRTADGQPCSSGAIVSPASLSCSQ